VLVHAAHGESHKLQSVRHALDATPGRRFKSEKDHHYPMANRLSLLSKRNEVNELLVQFAYDVNTFPATCR
jgi:hypothetical protein